MSPEAERFAEAWNRHQQAHAVLKTRSLNARTYRHSEADRALAEAARRDYEAAARDLARAWGDLIGAEGAGNAR